MASMRSRVPLQYSERRASLIAPICFVPACCVEAIQTTTAEGHVRDPTRARFAQNGRVRNRPRLVV